MIVSAQTIGAYPADPLRGGCATVCGSATLGVSRAMRFAEANNELVEVGAKYERRVVKSLLRNVSDTLSEIDIEALQDAIGAANSPAVMLSSKLDTLLERWSGTMNENLEKTTIAGAKTGYSLATSVGAVDSAMAYTFNLVNPRAVAWSREHTSTLMTYVDDTSRAGVQAVISTALSSGMDPAEAARLVSVAVGMTKRDVDAMLRYRASLVESGVPKDKLANRMWLYSRKALRRRGELIARTETMAAANEGARLCWDQLVADQLLDGNEWERRWLIAKDERTCPTCRPLNGKTAPINGTFEGGLGGPPKHMKCRCTHTLVRRTDMQSVLTPSSRSVTEAWKPTMTEAEAKEWSRDSVLKGTLYHGTSAAAAANIREHGFDLSMTGATTRGAGFLGQGVYLTADPDIANVYAKFNRNENGLLKLRVNVRKMMSAEDFNEFEREYGSIKVSATDADESAGVFGPRNATKQMIALGYDGVNFVSGRANEVVVFDPKRVTVVSE